MKSENLAEMRAKAELWAEYLQGATSLEKCERRLVEAIQAVKDAERWRDQVEARLNALGAQIVTVER